MGTKTIMPLALITGSVPVWVEPPVVAKSALQQCELSIFRRQETRSLRQVMSAETFRTSTARAKWQSIRVPFLNHNWMLTPYIVHGNGEARVSNLL